MIKPAKACAEQPHRGQCRRGGNLMARTRTRLHAPFTLRRGIGIPTLSMGSIKAHVEVDAFLKNSFWTEARTSRTSSLGVWSTASVTKRIDSAAGRLGRERGFGVDDVRHLLHVAESFTLHS